MRRQISTPSSSGICQSRTAIRGAPCCCSISQARLPSSASTTSKPHFWIFWVSSLRHTGSSSAMSTFICSSHLLSSDTYLRLRQIFQQRLQPLNFLNQYPPCFFCICQILIMAYSFELQCCCCRTLGTEDSNGTLERMCSSLQL